MRNHSAELINMCFVTNGNEWVIASTSISTATSAEAPGCHYSGLELLLEHKKDWKINKNVNVLRFMWFSKDPLTSSLTTSARNKNFKTVCVCLQHAASIACRVLPVAPPQAQEKPSARLGGSNARLSSGSIPFQNKHQNKKKLSNSSSAPWQRRWQNSMIKCREAVSLKVLCSTPAQACRHPAVGELNSPSWLLLKLAHWTAGVTISCYNVWYLWETLCKMRDLRQSLNKLSCYGIRGVSETQLLSHLIIRNNLGRCIIVHNETQTTPSDSLLLIFRERNKHFTR